MVSSSFSLLVLFAATLTSGVPIPRTSSTHEIMSQTKGLHTLRTAHEEIARTNASQFVQEPERPTQPSKPNIAQKELWQLHTVDSNHMANIADQKLSPRRIDTNGCSKNEDNYQDGKCVNMVNATPYRWRRGYFHSYHMSAWEERWPAYIEPGESISVLARVTNTGFLNKIEDSAAEVAYHIEGTSKPMSFMMEYRSGRQHSMYIRFLEDLEVLNHPKGAEFDLGGRQSPYGTGFIIAGKEGDFVTNNGPAAWMQTMLENLGDKPLREIVLGRTHHAGMWKGTGGIPNLWFNTVTQEATLYDQLRNGGARVLDVRIMKSAGKFSECHGSLTQGTWLGSIGVGFSEMIEQVNQFNEDYPGELIIWDIHPTEAWKFGDGTWKLEGSTYGFMDGQDRAQFLKELGKLNHRIALPEYQDITKLPLEHFINSREKKSAVIIRVDEQWLRGMDRKDWPGSREGFVTNKQFPVTSRWSEKLELQPMMDDQLRRLDDLQVSRKSTVYDMQWILTLVGFNSVYPVGVSLISLSHKAWDAAFRELFNVLTPDRYPNLLTVDGIRNSELKTLTMAMNHCFVLERCGDWVNERR